MPRAEPVLLCATAWCQRPSRTMRTMRIGGRERQVPMCGVHAGGELQALTGESAGATEQAPEVVDLTAAEGRSATLQG